MPTAIKRFFTPEEANRTLPLVKRVVRDILEKGRVLKGLAEREHPNVEDESAALALQSEVQELLQELEQVGCYYKDWGFETGLVDFPGHVGGELVFLCWRSDEEKVAWYHGINEGYKGRKPIPAASLK
jgi:hypothetical protein